MKMYFRHNAHPVALIPSLDQPNVRAQLWSDDKDFAVVNAPAGALVAQASLTVDLLYEHIRKEAEERENCPVVSIDTLKPARATAEQVKEYYDNGSLRFGPYKDEKGEAADIRYVWCSRSPRGGDTVEMDVRAVPADEGRIGVLFALKRGLTRGDWSLLENALSESDKEAVKKYGGRHWLMTWGVNGGIIVLTIVLVWAYYAFLRR
jgi:hypothetical protein